MIKIGSGHRIDMDQAYNAARVDVEKIESRLTGLI